MRNYDFYEHRRDSILIIILMCFLFIIIKLFSVQIINDTYKVSAENNIIRKIIKYPERGWIYDRNNHLLVANKRVHDLMVVPYQLDKLIDTVLFCNTLKISIEDFKKKIQAAKKKSYYKPSIFEQSVEKEKFAEIQENLHLFKGFYTQPKYVREYNTKSAGKVFGYISYINNKLLKNHPEYSKDDVIGVTGIEKRYEKILRGEKGVELKIVDVFGKYQGSFEEGKYDTLSKAGQDIVLTLDIELQEYAEKIMTNKRGSVVAIEPETGEILCLISSPEYNPSLFVGKSRSAYFRQLYLDPAKPLYNRSISGYYPPGSIFKLINALIGLQEKAINPGTLFNCNNGWNYKSSLHIGCHEHKSPLNLRQAIAQSCNSYFCSTFQNIINTQNNSAKGLDNWNTHIKSFGLNQIINTDLNNNKKGFFPNSEYYNKLYGKNRWGASTCISLGIGQDALLMTPIQMANISAIIANRGYYKIPHLMKLTKESNDNIYNHFNEKYYCSVDSKYFRPVIYGMETAISGTYGTAKLAKLSNTKICGKTGTAQNPHGKDHSIFIGFAPKKNPKIAIAVYIENGGWGGDVAAPIASLCIEKYLNKKISRIDLENLILDKKINY